ncbi:hypothetical protein H4R20_000343 [Coemansia guatemalensis]|uniref:Uncharacterized protein n=1 Tax=Coemansia guatemalensis TaxID=2761395 RepID=A0A9W8LVK0_9FUNG|nr:hypothetical protein H4R20_000343 [Coemansia guatemalensis]
MPEKPSDTLMSGVTFSEDSINRASSTSGSSKTSPDVTDCSHIPFRKCSTSTRTSVQSMDDIQTNVFSNSAKNLKLMLQGNRVNSGTHSNPELARRELLPSKQKRTYSSSRRYVSPNADSNNAQFERVSEQPTVRESSGARPQKHLLSLGKLPPQLIQRGRNRTLISSHSSSSPFRIPTLALFRLLLYPLIPIFSFTLMCVVRWVWFRSAMPSRWEILNVLSGFLRALEGFLCLIVFLLNPALNRSFREIRKRNTPVFT